MHNVHSNIFTTLVWGSIYRTEETFTGDADMANICIWTNQSTFLT